MNEVTKVHLSRNAFTISVDAKHVLQDYLDAIEKHVDSEVLSEIEARMAELLIEREITTEKVVLREDVEFLKQQLGDPKDFADEDAEVPVEQQPRRLMKDSRGQILGGVANGLGTFFGIDPLWFRIAFIALIFASGFGVLLYLILWMILPEAKTASDFLQLKGEPVTAETIKNFHASAGETFKKINVRSPLRKSLRILEKLAAIGFVLLAIGILVGASFGSAFVLSSPIKEVFPKTPGEVILFGMMWVAASSFAGILLVFSMRLWQSAKVIKKPLIALFSILILSCSIGLGLSVYTVDSVSARWDQQTKHKVTSFQGQVAPQKLVVQGSADATRRLNVQFVQTTGEVKLEQVTYPGMPELNLQVSNENGAITLIQKPEQNKGCGIVCRSFNYPEEVILYAPQISDVSATQTAVVTINNLNIESLTLTAEKSASININNGQAKSIGGSASENGTLALIGLTTQSATFNLDSYSYVYIPKSQITEVTAPCTQELRSPTIKVETFPAVKLVLNGQAVTQSQAQNLRCFDMWESSLYDESTREGQV